MLSKNVNAMSTCHRQNSQYIKSSTENDFNQSYFCFKVLNPDDEPEQSVYHKFFWAHCETFEQKQKELQLVKLKQEE